MREYIVSTLVLLLFQAPAPHPSPSAVPEGWQTVADGKGLCRIAVPPDWVRFSDASGAAVFKDASTAIAVVTSQPGQEFKPLPEAVQRVLHIPKDKLFENSAKHIFYQDRISRNPDDPNAFSASVPAKNGTCSCHVTFLPSVSAEIVRKIALSLGPVPD